MGPTLQQIEGMIGGLIALLPNIIIGLIIFLLFSVVLRK